ncbi:hypothetical protein WCD74_01155 [Actinomycetospora sp. OC33-EN08]|uniref:Uncharacterized protein n=1 Tax=Actinomycetospora aurantiaca TaxID=3129233 RepID=A0ABU8MGL0_9PSEU
MTSDAAGWTEWRIEHGREIAGELDGAVLVSSDEPWSGDGDHDEPCLLPADHDAESCGCGIRAERGCGRIQYASAGTHRALGVVVLRDAEALDAGTGPFEAWRGRRGRPGLLVVSRGLGARARQDLADRYDIPVVRPTVPLERFAEVLDQMWPLRDHLADAVTTADLDAALGRLRGARRNGLHTLPGGARPPGWQAAPLVDRPRGLLAALVLRVVLGLAGCAAPGVALGWLVDRGVVVGGWAITGLVLVAGALTVAAYVPTVSAVARLVAHRRDQTDQAMTIGLTTMTALASPVLAGLAAFGSGEVASTCTLALVGLQGIVLVIAVLGALTGARRLVGRRGLTRPSPPSHRRSARASPSWAGRSDSAGWVVWQASRDGDGFALVQRDRREPWSSGTTVAGCLVGDHEDDEVPAAGCRCGLRARSVPFRERRTFAPVLGVALLGGTVRRRVRGLRAAAATPRLLIAPSRWDPEDVADLERSTGATVLSYDGDVQALPRLLARRRARADAVLAAVVAEQSYVPEGEPTPEALLADLLDDVASGRADRPDSVPRHLSRFLPVPVVDHEAGMFRWGTRVAVAVGVVVGAALGTLAGGWPAGLAGAWVGMTAGLSLGRGVTGIVASHRLEPRERREAGGAILFGVGAVLGAGLATLVGGSAWLMILVGCGVGGALVGGVGNLVLRSPALVAVVAALVPTAGVGVGLWLGVLLASVIEPTVGVVVCAVAAAGLALGGWLAAIHLATAWTGDRL